MIGEGILPRLNLGLGCFIRLALVRYREWFVIEKGEATLRLMVRTHD